MPARSIYFISSALNPKKNSSGGNVVLYRHLTKLQEEGFNVVFINAQTHKETHSAFDQLNLSKNFWYPPVRKIFPWLTWLRFSLHRRQISKLVLFKENDLVISLLEDSASLLAALTASYHKIPLYLFYHDDNVFSEYFRDSKISLAHLKWIIRHCKHFFAVSEPMKQLLINKGAASASVLYPLPEGLHFRKDLEKVNFEHPNIVHAGSLFIKFHSEILKSFSEASSQVSAKTTFIGTLDENFLPILNQYTNTQTISRFETTEKLFDYLLEHADALLVFYSMDMQMEIRSRYSFPSKFVEFCHLGIPIVLIAPDESAVGKWAIENAWPTYLSNDDPNKISNLLVQLKDKIFWQKASEKCLQHAAAEFNPDVIHREMLVHIS